MCGIVGILDVTGRRAIDRALLSQMNETQHHRGPDEADLYLEPGLGLGHRRLSVIDLAAGLQPLANEDGTVMVCFNGEIYNFRELTAELTALGHRFRTRCDTEVIVHAWEQWGADCVHRFRGMFAFGLWDRKARRLFLARDRLGVKPLYYCLTADGYFAFSSELKALVTLPGLDRRIDPCAVEDYFAYGYIAEPRTIYRGALKLSPGHTLLQLVGAPLASPARFWDVPFALHAPMAEAAVQTELIERLREAVRIRMVADVPLGAFLSGGIDSGAVVAMMAGLSGQPVNTCTIGFCDPAYDESAYAAQVAARHRTSHHTGQVGINDYQLLDTLAGLYDEPFADSSAIPTYRVCQLARKRVTVALSGDGGDESLAGYRRYRYAVNEHRLRARMPQHLRERLFGLLGRWYPKADWAPRVLRAKTTFEALSRDLVEAYFHGVTLMSDEMRGRLFSPGFKRDLQGYRAIEVLRRHAAAAPTAEPLSLLQYLDLKTYLPGDILTKVDRASMAHALEVRAPLLDHQLVEWISGLPATLKLRAGEGKYIFKKSLAAHLPPDILYRKKMGFAVPLARWFRGPLKQRVHDALLGPLLGDSGLFDIAYLRHLLEHHQAGLRDYSAPIWALLMFEAFLRKELTA